MPVTVSLTTFVDFAAATGIGKAGQVQRAKRQYGAGYMASFDYWLTLRNGIVAMHRDGRPPSSLNGLLTGLHDSKVGNYTLCIDAYRKWLGRTRLRPVPHNERGEWKTGQLVVRVNPELMVDVNSQPHAIKLYFSAPPISKARVDLSLHLIRKAVGPRLHAAILDVRRGKLHSNIRTAASMDTLLDGEAQLFVRLWEAS